MPFTEVPTRFRNFPVTPGGGVTYGDLTLQFIVDEDLVNYKSVHDWIRKNGGAEEHSPDEIEFSAGQLLSPLLLIMSITLLILKDFSQSV